MIFWVLGILAVAVFALLIWVAWQAAKMRDR